MVIEQHFHCPACGKPMPTSEKFCSPDCEEAFKQRELAMRKQRRILYIVIAAFVIIWIVLLLKGK
ncbi:MAG: DUF2116 family Zn-ribbon domain-containing protein [Methanobacteriaceae archaeon]|nr:DUF2116 family Zn-ribbon domain-containing protein [Methanobacteriaceae archaeon]